MLGMSVFLKQYHNARYVSVPEAIWHLFQYSMHHQFHTVVRLGLHLPNYQVVYFQPGKEELTVKRALQNDIHFLSWFILNME